MRVACLELPVLPLQLVWRAEPALRELPVVVVAEDRPQGEVRWACERARAAGVLPGQRYAHALAMCSALRARVVQPEQIEAATAALRTALHRMSPRVEPGDPGTFWLDGDGLARIFPSATAWGKAIAGEVEAAGLAGAVVVGWSRFATFAIARAQRTGVTVLRTDAEERARAGAVPLARLDLDAALRDSLARLAVTTVGQLVRLPGGGILERYGRDAHRLYQLAARERWDPIVPVAPPEAPDERVLLDDDEEDIEHLAFVLKAPVERLVARLAARGRALTALHVELTLKHAVGKVEVRADCIVPAAPTLDARVLMRLVHLRLTGAPPAAPINAVRVWPDDEPASREQLALFAARPRRDLRAADEALARVRAELGEDAVVCAVLRDGHLPEAQFGWERLAHVVAARPREVAVRPLVRRIFTRPQRLPVVPRKNRNDGWLIAGLERGAVTSLHGPFVISGGWWVKEVRREYHYAEVARGDTLWVYFDSVRNRWFWQGTVE